MPKYARCRSLSYFCRVCTVRRLHVACAHQLTLRELSAPLCTSATLVIGPVRRVGGSASQGVTARSLCGVLLLRLLRPNCAAEIIREQYSKPRLAISQRQ